MNILKEKCIVFLRQQYVKNIRKNKLRKILKYLLNNDRVKIKYENIKLLVGLNSSIEHAVFFDDYNEKSILKLISYFSSKSYVFLDVGANIGLHSLTASKSNKEIEVFSFEPEPNNFNAFIKNIGLNNVSNIRPFCFGVGNFNGACEMNINPGCNKGTHSLKIKFTGQTKRVNIPIIMLDGLKDIVASDEIMLKIDVEGFEKEVVIGALELLSNAKSIIIVIELLEETNGEIICEEIIEILKLNNFISIFKINNKGTFDVVNSFQGSGDYVFLKGTKTLNLFNSYI